MAMKKTVECAYCGKRSDRGCIAKCRECSGMVKAVAKHPYRPMTMRDGSKACADCYATPSHAVHQVEPK